MCSPEQTQVSPFLKYSFPWLQVAMDAVIPKKNQFTQLFTEMMKRDWVSGDIPSPDWLVKVMALYLFTSLKFI